MSDNVSEMNVASAVAGFQVPLGIKKRKKNVDELLNRHSDINEGVALSYFSSLDESQGETVGLQLEQGQIDPVADEMRTHAVRELIRTKMKEVVRKKAGGGGYALYAPNKGKKGKAKPVGSFPTKMGAKRAELARYPPKEPGKLKRLRKEVDRLAKDPKKAAEKEKKAGKSNGSDKGPKTLASPKKESVQLAEHAARRMDFMHRQLLSRVIVRSLKESLFREEKTESEWDDYIGKLSKQALAGDKKFQTLQKNISKKTEKILEDAFGTIRKATGKTVKLKSYGIKHDSSSGKTYLAFGAEFDDVTSEPIYIHVEGGVPKIELSQNAKVALTKADPDDAKMFRAELVTVQERVLDNMDDLSRAIQNRDKYLSKLENEVDSYVAGLDPLQVSLLKQLLVRKYRKTT